VTIEFNDLPPPNGTDNHQLEVHDMNDRSPTAGRIFISSTCGDLTDLRAVLERGLRDAGVVPVLSDRKSSGFTNPGDVGAIQLCLINLRSCERCVLVLSDRYGAPLMDERYGGLSATHLEYREAIKSGIPVHFYVRDSLWARYELHTQGRATPAVPDTDEARLLEFIREHVNKQRPDEPSWRWTYTNAVDLTDRVLADLGSVSSSATIRMLAAQNRLPQLSINHESSDGRAMLATLTNVGQLPILRATIVDPKGQRAGTNLSLAAGTELKFRYGLDVGMWSTRADHCPIIQVHYDIASGERLADLFAVLPPSYHPRIVLAGRRCVGRSMGLTFPEILHVHGRPMIPLPPLNQAYEQFAL